MTAAHRDGHELPVEMTISEVRYARAGADALAFHAFLRDISERKLSERIRIATQSVTQAMARADSPEEAKRSLLCTLGDSMGWQVGGYWQPADDGSLEQTANWSADGVPADAFAAVTGELRLAPGEGLPGQALQDGEPVWVRDYTADDRFPRAAAARLEGLHAAIAVPVTRGKDTIGIFEFFTADLRVREQSVCDALAAVGAHVGELIGVLEDRQALLASLERLALTDQLTGLPNRRAWEEVLQRELARADREDSTVCVAVIDLDEFNAIRAEVEAGTYRYRIVEQEFKPAVYFEDPERYLNRLQQEAR